MMKQFCHARIVRAREGWLMREECKEWTGKEGEESEKCIAMEMGR